MNGPKTIGGATMKEISKLPPEAQRRIHVTAQILRDLLAQDDENQESMLAFTLVWAEIADGLGCG